MTSSPPSKVNKDPEALDSRLSLLIVPQHYLVTKLLNQAMTEIIPPPAPPSNPLPVTTSTNIVFDQEFTVSETACSCERNTTRFLYTKEPCCCTAVVPLANHVCQDFPSGWERAHLTDMSSSSHCVLPVTNSPRGKSDSITCKCKSKTNSLAKSSSTGRIDVPGRYSKGYLYEKNIIPFHFQHFEGDTAPLYAESYRKSHTYPNMEEKLKSSSCADYSSYSAPSVIEPKLLVLGISKPGATEGYRPPHNRQYHKLYTTQHAFASSTHSMSVDKTSAKLGHTQLEIESVSPPQMYHHSIGELESKSTSVLEVFHGQSSPNQLHHLPPPVSPDSPPSLNQTISQQQSGNESGKSSTTPNAHLHFRDILSVNDTQCLRARKRPNVKWASHKFPLNLVPSVTPNSGSPRTRRQQLSSVNKLQPNRTRVASFPRARNAHTIRTHSTGDLPCPPVCARLSDLSSTSFSKLTPRAKKDSFTKTQQNENRTLKGRAEACRNSHKTSREHLSVAQGIRRNRKVSSKHTTSLVLMPKSVPLVPSLGVYSRTALAQNSTQNF